MVLPLTVLRKLVWILVMHVGKARVGQRLVVAHHSFVANQSAHDHPNCTSDRHSYCPASLLSPCPHWVWSVDYRWFQPICKHNPMLAAVDKSLKLCSNQIFIFQVNQWEKIQKSKYLPKCVPMPKQSILWPCSFKLSIVSSLISFDATIVSDLNHGILKRSETKLNVSRAKHDR